MTRPRRFGRRAGRPRVVAWIVAVNALGLVLLILAVSVGLRAGVSSDIEQGIAQEAAEIHRFSTSGLDPATGQPFQTAERFIEVYVARQQPEPAETLLGGRQDGDTVLAEITGSGGHGIAGLEPATRDQILVPGSEGTLSDARSGRISWQNVEVLAPQSRGHITVLLFHEPREAQVRSQLGTLALLALGALLATGVVAWWVSGWLMVHLLQFEDAAEALPVRLGQVRFPDEGSDEYRRLARAANRALGRAEEVAERERRFTEDAAYQLRTPLAILHGGLEQPGTTAQQQAATRDRSLTEIRRLRDVLGALVQLTRSERPDYVQPQARVRLDSIVDEVVDLWQARLQRADSQVRVEAGLTVRGIRCLADEPRLVQAVDEIVENAVRASPPGAAVQVGTDVADDEQGRWAVLEVRDSGRGVPQEDLERILGRFAVAGNDPDPGAGLGLAVADRLVAGMGGTLDITAVADGPGTLVRIRLRA